MELVTVQKDITQYNGLFTVQTENTIQWRLVTVQTDKTQYNGG